MHIGYLGPLTGAISYYRGLGPLTRFAKETHYELINITVGGDLWERLRGIDVIYSIREIEDESIELYRMAKKLGIKIIFDIDDDLLNIPIEHSAFPHYARKNVRHNIQEALTLADVVITSTHDLKESLYRQHPRQYEVVNNAVDEKFFKLHKHPWQGQHGIAWRGSDTHDFDIRTMATPLLKFVNETPGMELHLWGYYSWSLIRETTNSVHYHGTQEFLKYMLSFIETRPKVVIVPLADNQFNRSKSNIAWIEATQAGAVTIAPRFPEFMRPGVFTYENQREFLDHLITVFSEPETVQRAYSASLADVESNYTLLTKNIERYKIIKELLHEC